MMKKQAASAAKLFRHRRFGAKYARLGVKTSIYPARYNADLPRIFTDWQLRRTAGDASLARMRLWLVAALTIAGPASAGARPLAPLYDPVTLNIGLACQWQHDCIDAQVRAMKRARSFVARRKPPLWRIHQCNRNAARSGHRVDWVGFDNCIRNARLRRPR